MSRLLDEYLAQVAKSLGSLPSARREEELRELRQHLMSAAFANQEQGQSEDEAAANAIIQFGQAEDLSSKIVTAWLRERSRNRETLYSIIWAMIMPWLGFPLHLNSFWSHLFKPFLETHDSLMLCSLAIVNNAIFGALLGYIYPRRAVQSIGAAQLILLSMHEFVDRAAPLSVHIDTFCICMLIIVAPCVYSAWAVSKTQLIRHENASLQK